MHCGSRNGYVRPLRPRGRHGRPTGTGSDPTRSGRPPITVGNPERLLSPSILKDQPSVRDTRTMLYGRSTPVGSPSSFDYTPVPSRRRGSLDPTSVGYLLLKRFRGPARAGAPTGSSPGPMVHLNRWRESSFHRPSGRFDSAISNENRR